MICLPQTMRNPVLLQLKIHSLVLNVHESDLDNVEPCDSFTLDDSTLEHLIPPDIL